MPPSGQSRLAFAPTKVPTHKGAFYTSPLFQLFSQIKTKLCLGSSKKVSIFQLNLLTKILFSWLSYDGALRIGE